MTSPPPSDRTTRMRALRDALRAWSPPLDTVAESMLALDARIDLLSHDGSGQTWVVGLAEAGEDLTALADLLAQRSWVAPRIGDWLQLAPDLGLDATRGVRGLLVSEEFEARTLAAAAGLPGDAIALARLRGSDAAGWRLQTIGPAGSVPGDMPSNAPPRLESRFRTGLDDETEADAPAPASAGERLGS